MAQTSAFRGTFDFFEMIGILDVVLPFLLVFTIVFAILEKTRVFGTEDVNGQKVTKKNLNSMASFVIAFMVIASSKLVGIVTEVSSNVVILLLLSVLFLLLVGSFYKEDEFPVALTGAWRYLFMGIMFIGIVLIFLNAIETKDGTPWLEWIWDQVTNNFNSNAVASIILVIVIVAFMYYIVRSPSTKKEKEEKK